MGRREGGGEREREREKLPLTEEKTSPVSPRFKCHSLWGQNKAYVSQRERHRTVASVQIIELSPSPTANTAQRRQMIRPEPARDPIVAASGTSCVFRKHAQ